MYAEQSVYESRRQQSSAISGVYWTIIANDLGAMICPFYTVFLFGGTYQRTVGVLLVEAIVMEKGKCLQILRRERRI
jgi:hypothetical protein